MLSISLWSRCTWSLASVTFQHHLLNQMTFDLSFFASVWVMSGHSSHGIEVIGVCQDHMSIIYCDVLSIDWCPRHGCWRYKWSWVCQFCLQNSSPLQRPLRDRNSMFSPPHSSTNPENLVNSGPLLYEITWLESQQLIEESNRNVND